MRATTRAPGDDRAAPARRRRAGVAAAAAGLATTVLAPWPLGILFGAPVALGFLRWFSTLEPAEARRRRVEIARDLPLAADLFAACVVGGADPATAAEQVAAAVRGPLGERLLDVTQALGLGEAPERTWVRLLADPELADWGRTMARSAATGARPAEVVGAVAADARARRRSSAAAAARRVGVVAALPLGLCFLPAFVLLGVVPLVVSLIGPLLGSLG